MKSYMIILIKYYHKFVNKHRDFLIINEPHDFDKAVDQLVAYNKYKTSDVIERKDNGEPIVTYYYNLISSLDDITLRNIRFLRF